MKRNLENENDIALLVDEFYKKVKLDPVIGYIFNEVVDFSWEKHIPIMNSFWQSVLLGKASYQRNAMAKHLDLNKRSPLDKEHFDRWKKLFFETLDEHFEGEKVAEAKKTAESIGALILHKIAQAR